MQPFKVVLSPTGFVREEFRLLIALQGRRLHPLHLRFGDLFFCPGPPEFRRGAGRPVTSIGA